MALAAIAAYVVPFNWESISQTQAQPSLYERLNDRVNGMKEISNNELDDLIVLTAIKDPKSESILHKTELMKPLM